MPWVTLAKQSRSTSAERRSCSGLASVTVVPVTSTLVNAPLFRLAVEPSAHNGLRALSQVMVDKLITVRRERIGAVIGALEPGTLTRVNRALALWLGVAG
jgi:mRNA interferase MazF